MSQPSGHSVCPSETSRAAIDSSERFRLLVEGVKDYAIFFLDPSGRVETWNSGAQRILGYREEEIVGKHLSIFYPPEVNSLSKCNVELEVAARDGRFEDEDWRIRKDGSHLWARVTTTALRDPAGQLIGFAKVTQDLTARRAAEEETRRFRLLVESVKDYAIFILDPSGHISTWNAGAQRIKGYSEQEIIGKHFSIFYPPEVNPPEKCALALGIAERDARFEEEGWRLKKGGSRFWASVVITTLRDDQQRVVGFAKVTRDLTQRREAEEARRAVAEQRAALTEKARIQEFQERFLAVLGHDLRNPLASVDMGIDVLRAKIREPEILRILARMQSSTNRMVRMIEQILDLTRSRLANGLQLYVHPMNLQTTLSKIVEELRIAHPERVITMSAPDSRINADQDRMEQVFSNLLGNAIAHGDPAQPISVEAQVNHQEATIRVHNYGTPVPEELKSRLFDPFRRGERDSRTSKTDGLGLGLYISSEIVRGHGGAIYVESTLERGTTFGVTLPLDPASKDDPRTAQ